MADERAYITGLDVPRFTDSYYATDPSQQSSQSEGCYPYVTFPLGVPNPTAKPTASAPVATGTTADYGYAQEETVNQVIIASGGEGTGYATGDLLDVDGGTIVTGLYGARVKVTQVGDSGMIQEISLVRSGFYTAGAGPSSPATATNFTGSGTGALFSVTTVSQSFDGLNAHTEDNSAGHYINWSINGSSQLHVDSGQGDLTCLNTVQSFGLQTCSRFTFQCDMESEQDVEDAGDHPDLVMYLCGAYNGSNAIDGPGVVLSPADGNFTLYSTFTGTNGSAVNGTEVDQVSLTSVSVDTLYRIVATCVANTSATVPGFNTSVTLALAATPDVIIATLSGFIAYNGESLGVGTNHRGQHDDANGGDFENMLVSVTQPPNAANVVSTNYVYTWIQQLPHDVTTNGPFQESGPSDPSATIDVFIDGSTNPPTRTETTIIIPAAPALGIAGEPSYIVGANLYRLVADVQGNESYVLVNVGAPIAVSTSGPTTVLDSAQDSAIGPTILPSFDPTVPGSLWEPPPTDLFALVALPNGIMAGLSKDQACLCAPYHYHAWPQSNRYKLNSFGVGLAALQTTLFALTKKNPETGFGSDPAQFTFTKEPSLYACVAKRSISTDKVLGAIYASGMGVTYFRGQGDLDLVKINCAGEMKAPFDYEQWQALNPSSIVGIVHDNAYWFSFTTASGDKGSYALSLRPDGFGLIELDFHVTAWFLDQRTGLLHLVPDMSTYAINGDVIDEPSNIVSQWDYSTTSKRTYVWERRDLLLDNPQAFIYARVRAETFANTTITISNENGTSITKVVSSPLPFVIGHPSGKPASRWTARITGTDQVNDLQLAQSASEFMGQ